MHAASRIDNSTDLSRLESERRLLKLLLHVPVTKEPPWNAQSAVAPRRMTEQQVSEKKRREEEEEEPTDHPSSSHCCNRSHSSPDPPN